MINPRNISEPSEYVKQYSMPEHKGKRSQVRSCFPYENDVAKITCVDLNSYLGDLSCVLPAFQLGIVASNALAECVTRVGAASLALLSVPEKAAAAAEEFGVSGVVEHSRPDAPVVQFLVSLLLMARDSCSLVPGVRAVKIFRGRSSSSSGKQVTHHVKVIDKNNPGLGSRVMYAPFVEDIPNI